MTKGLLSLKTKLRAFTAIVVAILLCLSLGFLTACSDETETEYVDTSKETDTQVIKNGNFEYFDSNKGYNVILGVNNWTNSVDTNATNASAKSSSSKSGVIYTGDSYLSTDSASTNVLAENGWDFLTGAATESTSLRYIIDEDSAGYNADEAALYNVDEEDIPTCANPSTHSGDDGHVLMINNNRTNSLSSGVVYGTAQKYTSSSTVTLTANTSAYFSVWVKTSDLTYTNSAGQQVAADANRGAYIGVNHTVGGKSLDRFEIKNINTSGVTENNGWVKYTVYLKACNYTSSTFGIVLGLGHGGGTSVLDYVQGYAFFDDIEYGVMTNTEYDSAVSTNGAVVCSATADKADKLLSASTYSTKKHFALDLSTDFTAFDLTANIADVDIGLTSEESNNNLYNIQNYGSFNISVANDQTGVYSTADLANISNNYYTSKVKSELASAATLFGADSDTILLLSAGGANYTATLDFNEFTIAPDSTICVSFWTKTSAMDSFEGATVRVKDNERYIALGPFDTTTRDKVVVNDNDDVYDGWTQMSFAVTNYTTQNQSFKLVLNYGKTTVVGTSATDYTEGYAAFTNFEYASLTNAQLDGIATSDTSAIVDLYGELGTNPLLLGFNTPSQSEASTIEQGLAVPSSFYGVAGNSAYVGGSDITAVNDNEYSGLINKLYANNYFDNNDAWFANLKSTAQTNGISVTRSDWWDKIIGASTMPLLIVNNQEQAYGYYSRSNVSIAANGYSVISMRVFVSSGALAYVYLVDASDKYSDHTEMLSVKTPAYTYWYDDDGNVYYPYDGTTYVGDKTNFKAKDYRVYTIQSNGLHTDSDGKYRANLSVYNAVYTNVEKTEGYYETADGENTVFYIHEGKTYYKYDKITNAYSVEVLNFDVQYKRYQSDDQKLVMAIDGNDASVANKWVTVNFYVSAGDEAKSYRLETWSGSRNGQLKSAANSYVIFDRLSPDDLSSSFSNLLKYNVDKIIDQSNGTYTDDIIGYDDAIYYTYTIYDDVNYVRFDEDDDENESKANPYRSYEQGSFDESIAYLYFFDEDNLTYSTFADYNSIEYAYADTTDNNNPATDDATGDDTNVWLLVSSLVIALALIATLVAMLIRTLLKDRKQKFAKTSHYSSQRKHYVKLLKEDGVDVDYDYDDDEDVSDEELYGTADENKTDNEANADASDENKDGEDK